MDSIPCKEEVTIHLEKLNEASSVINELEIQIEKSRQQYKNILLEATENQSQNNFFSKSFIEKARPYFDAISRRKNIMIAISRNSELYSDAKARHEEAKQFLLSFNGISKFQETERSKLDHINLAINNVNLCKELERDLQIELEHLLSQCRVYDELCRQQESRFSTSIKKARPYFEKRNSIQQRMQDIKQNIENLSELVAEKKKTYAQSMKHLEAISDEIHCSRMTEITKFPSPITCFDPSCSRSMGVGAESSSSNSSSTVFVSNLKSKNQNVFRSQSLRLADRSSETSDSCSTRPTPPGQLDTENEDECADVPHICRDFDRKLFAKSMKPECTRLIRDLFQPPNAKINCAHKIAFAENLTTSNSLSTTAYDISNSSATQTFGRLSGCSRPSSNTLCGPCPSPFLSVNHRHVSF